MSEGSAWCPACGPQIVEDSRWEGRVVQLFLACGHTRRAWPHLRRGGRWSLPAVPAGYRVAAVIVGPDGREYPKEVERGS